MQYSCHETLRKKINSSLMLESISNLILTFIQKETELIKSDIVPTHKILSIIVYNGFSNQLSFNSRIKVLQFDQLFTLVIFVSVYLLRENLRKREEISTIKKLKRINWKYFRFSLFYYFPSFLEMLTKHSKVLLPASNHSKWQLLDLISPCARAERV